MTLIDALTEEQKTIINRGLNDGYSVEESIRDIDLIAELTELKINLILKGGRNNVTNGS